MAAIWNDFMRDTAILSAITGVMFFLTPEKFANRVASPREIRRFGILMWLWVALYAIAYL